MSSRFYGLDLLRQFVADDCAADRATDGRRSLPGALAELVSSVSAGARAQCFGARPEPQWHDHDEHNRGALEQCTWLSIRVLHDVTCLGSNDEIITETRPPGC